MSNLKLTKTVISAGKWEGLLSGVDSNTPPMICAMLHDQIIEDIEPTSLDGSQDFHVAFSIPADGICEGVQTFLFVDAESRETLAHFSMVAGDVLADDLRAEIDLLRAELDMFKRVFRQHCIETS